MSQRAFGRILFILHPSAFILPKKDAPRVDVDHGGAAAELAGHGADQIGVLDRGGVDAHFLRSSLDQHGGVFEGADAAADGERHENLFGDATDDVEHNRPSFVAGADVEKHQFVGALFLVTPRDFDRITRIPERD